MQSKRAPRWLHWLLFATVVGLILFASFYLDDSMIGFVNDHPEPRLKAVGRFVSHYGDWPQHVILGIVVWIAAWLFRSCRCQRIVLLMIVASALGGITANAIRFATGRPRPATHIADGWYGPSAQYKYSSFPSGHTTASTAFFGVLLFVEWPIGCVALIVPFAVGAARIYVGAHHFSDIVASVIVGMLAAYAAARMIPPRVASAR